jgi:hypothetical protein
MKKRRWIGWIASLGLLLLLAVYLTGYLPWIQNEEQRLAYIIKTMENYNILEVVYDMNYDSMLLHGTYQWNQKRKEHRMKGAVTSEKLMSELIGFNGMIKGERMYFQMNPIMPQVYTMDLSQQEDIPILSEIHTIIQTSSLYDLLAEVKYIEKPRFKIILVNDRYHAVYICEGIIEKEVNAKEVKINYSIYTDGWGHIKKIDIEIQSDQHISFCGYIRPIKKMSIVSMNVDQAIAF